MVFKCRLHVLLSYVVGSTDVACVPFHCSSTCAAIMWVKFLSSVHSLQVRDRLLANGEEPIDERIPIQDVYGRTYCRYPET
jgi:hypothetical protein